LPRARRKAVSWSTPTFYLYPPRFGSLFVF
jgi:hypothetical protein